MENITDILNIPILQLFGLIVLWFIAERMGIPVVSIVKKLFKINGNEEVKNLKEQLNAIEGNHLHSLETKMDKLIELNQKILFLTEEIKNKVDK